MHEARCLNFFFYMDIHLIWVLLKPAGAQGSQGPQGALGQGSQGPQGTQ